MKKKFSLMLSLVMVFTVLFGLGANPKIAKAVDYTYGSSTYSYQYNDNTLDGTHNLNNTSSNSARVGNILKEPEIGWKRYDDANSNIKYTGNYWFHTVNNPYSYAGTSSDGDDKGQQVSFTINGSKLRIIGYQFKNNTHTNANVATVYADGASIGTINNLSTTDANQVLLFEYNFGTKGVHNITIQQINDALSDGTISQSLTLIIDAIDIDGGIGANATQLPARMNIDSPIVNTTYTGSFELRGWALNQSGIKSVQTFIDDVYFKDATNGLARPDVFSVYPQYNNYNSGFSYLFNVSDFKTPGNHTLKVKAVGNDVTSSQEQTLYLYVYATYIIVVPQNSQPTVQAVPLYRYSSSVEHMYTTNFNELGNGSGGYTLEGIEGYVFLTQQPGTVPLYRYYNGTDHLYTTNFEELGNGKYGYNLESTQCYVYPVQQTGTTPMYRYFNGTDHFYTTTFSELGNGNSSFTYEGIKFYILHK